MEAETIAEQQTLETVAQDLAGVTVREATVTCPCGTERALTLAYKCLYCKVWFCDICAEQHFGKTVSEYKASK